MTTTPTDRSISLSELDRRIAVAPMMDWTDDPQTSFAIRCLRVRGNACLLYVSSAARVFHETLTVA
jgi:tRNA-dihydrouridine synthase